MRLEAVLWLVAAGLIMVAPVAQLLRRRQMGIGSRVSPIISARSTNFYVEAFALLAILVGAGWHSAQTGAWMGAMPPEALALLAGGAMTGLLWWGGWQRLRPGQQHTGQETAGRGAAALAVALTLLIAAALGWNLPAVSAAPQAHIWLFGLRSLLAGLGLGGWLLIGAVALQESGREFFAWRAWRRRPRAPDGSSEPARDADDAAGQPQTAAAAGESAPGGLQGFAGAGLLARGSGSEREPQAGGQQAATPAAEAPGASNAPAGTATLALAGLRFSFPWLTAALLAAGLWNLIAFAVPWRSRPADLWLAAAWLIGGACLHLAPYREREVGARLYLAALAVLALAGLAAAFLAALQAPSLFW